ncbi:HemY protein [Neisseria gonorrhoeae]|uniref:HemY protein n=1 Tax=Neisseria gonorrhoeae TaxID=485 RepID=A0A378W1H3_NEIGO|nr:HemY protein [Neisseria gonorrhoeae]
MGEREQQKAIDFADSWLKEQPDNALLLMYLGRLAYGRKLWGKAKGYLEASIALKPSIPARLVLAKVLTKPHSRKKPKHSATWFGKRCRGKPPFRRNPLKPSDGIVEMPSENHFT